MTEQEAKDYLRWYKDKSDEYHYLASFTSSRPFHVDYPESIEKRQMAFYVLGKHTYQQPFANLKMHWPNMTREYYEEKVKILEEKFGKSK